MGNSAVFCSFVGQCDHDHQFMGESKHRQGENPTQLLGWHQQTTHGGLGTTPASPLCCHQWLTLPTAKCNLCFPSPPSVMGLGPAGGGSWAGAAPHPCWSTLGHVPVPRVHQELPNTWQLQPSLSLTQQHCFSFKVWISAQACWTSLGSEVSLSDDTSQAALR